jgi:chemotaxis protein methyltransferase CheR
MTELGIVDIREIIRTIKLHYNYDFADYALTSFKQRLERVMIRNNIDSPEKMITKLQKESGFFNTFLSDIAVPSTELFRDPSLWRWLREVYFPSVIEKTIGKFKIWLPYCVSGGELYSLTILLSEMDMLDKVYIVATCISDILIDKISEGCYDPKKIDVSVENYKRFNGSRDLSTYFKTDQGCVLSATSLIRNVEFRKLTINFDNAPVNNKLILFRNNLIYYNPTMQERVLQILHETLSGSGHLILGIREKIVNSNTNRDFEVINEAESVYRKRPIL